MKQIDCTRVYAHTFAEVEYEMGKAPRGTRMIVYVTEAGEYHKLKVGDTLAFSKKNRQFSSFHKDAGTWLDKNGYEQDGQRLVRDLLDSLHRCGFKFAVTLE